MSCYILVDVYDLCFIVVTLKHQSPHFLMSGGYPLNPGPYPAQPGGLSKDKCISAEGLSEVLCFAFRTDNTGPPETVQVKSHQILKVFFVLFCHFVFCVLI